MLSSIITFILILFIVRLVIILIKRQDYSYGNPFMENIDRSIAPLVHNISKIFTGGRKITYKVALIIAIIVLFVLQFGGGILFTWLANLIAGLPF